MPDAPAAPRDLPSWSRPLSHRPRTAQVRLYRRSMRAVAPHLRLSGWNVLASLLTIVFMVSTTAVVLLIAAFFLFLALSVLLGWADSAPPLVRVLALPLAVLTALGTWLLLRMLLDVARRDLRFGIRWRRAAMLQAFADANGLDYVPAVPDPPALGMIFTAGTRRLVLDLIAGDEGVPFEVGNHQYAGLAHERSLRRFGFVHLELPRVLPHMVLVSQANRRSFRRSNLPWRLPRDQVLPLGEPFDRHFTLHCPARYQEDARYVFTPKLMAVLVEHARDFDVEIVDRRLLLYRARPLDMTDPRTYELLGRLIGSVGVITAARSRLYEDPRIRQPYVIGRGGQRLQMRAPVLGIVIGVLGGAYCIARVVTFALGVGM